MASPPSTPGLGQQESPVDRGGSVADGDLPVPGSAGPRHAVPAGRHVAALHCELAQLEGVQLRSGTVVLPVPASLSSRGVGPDRPVQAASPP